MNATKVLTIVLTVLAVTAVTKNATAQEGSQPDGGAMMGHDSQGGAMMGQGGAMMGGQSQGGGMMGSSMMGHSGMGMGMGGARGHGSMCTAMTSHIEGRLAFLKAEIKITPEQESRWNDYAAAVRANAQAMTPRCALMMSQAGAKEASLPDRLDVREQFLAAQIDALRVTSKALKPLYGALSDAQKQVADQLIRGMTGMM
jgi:hypothetical protein